jgi:hypothetical protein
MMAFEDGSDGVRVSHSSFVPVSLRTKIFDRLMRCGALTKIYASADSHSKFAIRLFLVRRTNHEQRCLRIHHSAAFGLRILRQDNGQTAKPFAIADK